jgi:hypothetical protein
LVRGESILETSPGLIVASLTTMRSTAHLSPA